MLRRNAIIVAENNSGAVSFASTPTSPTVSSMPGISGDLRMALERSCIVSHQRTQAPQTIFSCFAAADFLVVATRRCGEGNLEREIWEGALGERFCHWNWRGCVRWRGGIIGLFFDVASCCGPREGRSARLGGGGEAEEAEED
jgi:hypothetical protein